VASLARPGGNLTGINLFTAELVAKRLGLLRELVPRATRVAVMVHSADVTTTESTLAEAQAAARAISMQIQLLKVNSSRDIDATFETIARERPDALLVSSSPFFIGRHVQLVQLAAYHRLPAAYTLREFAEIGGLMTYGPNIGDAWRQAGVYAGRILKGAKPTDLPVGERSGGIRVLTLNRLKQVHYAAVHSTLFTQTLGASLGHSAVSSAPLHVHALPF
jgi:putative tryptophan/tyrosine transport system substrate-binding protein